jgi:DNA-binding transcriptional MerR regulator
MQSFSIGDLERFLGVKAHVIRYWEREIPFIQPRKDLGGRRIYGKRDVLMFSRLKYLLYDRKFTVEGAKEQLYRDLSGGNEDARAAMDELRSDLLDLYFLVRRDGED